MNDTEEDPASNATHSNAESPVAPDERRRGSWLPVCLIACVFVVGFWEFMSHRSLQAGGPSRITGKSLAGFAFDSDRWKVTDITVGSDDPSAPTLVSYAVESREWPPAIIRLTLGYNMPECMEIKHYDITMIADHLQRDGCQYWQLYSDSGATSAWTTVMLRSADFAVTGTSTSDMDFPRVISGDNARWVPQGLTLASLRHPIRNFHAFMINRWNASRSDLATFLKLRRPAMPSDEELTVVINMNLPAVAGPDTMSAATAHLQLINRAFLSALQQWRSVNPMLNPSSSTHGEG
ncbi:MAG: hypothetical protein O2901_08560 [Verrucomicrobia bacterium]|nr:hypothetical protein [Verrucomicrobiota bacterium]